MSRRSLLPRLTQGVLFLGLVLAPLAARAEDPPESDAVAAEVRAAFEVGDAAKLAALAGRKQPDAWLVADRLIEEGAVDAAIAFAGASKRPGTRGIAAYAEGRRDKPPTPAATRAALLEARAGFEARDYARVLKALEGVVTNSRSAADAQVLFVRGMGHWGLAEYDKAAVSLDAALELARSLGWLNLQSYILNWAAVTAVRRKAPRRSLELARVRVDLETEWGRTKQLTAALHDLATAQRETGDRRGARRTLERMLKQSREGSDAAALERTLLTLASVSSDLYEHADAARYAREALRSAERRKYSIGIVKGLTSLGAVLSIAGGMARGQQYLERAVKLARKETRVPTLLSEALSHLALTYLWLGQFPQALNTFEQALQLRLASEDRRGAAFVASNLGSLYHKMGQAGVARTYMEQARALFQEARYPAGIASTSTSLAELAMQRSEFAEAETLLRHAMTLHIASWDRLGEAGTTASLGSLAVHQRDFEKAEKLYERAGALYRELNDARAASSVRARLGALRVKQGRVDEGIQLIEESIAAAHANRSLPRLVELKSALAAVLLEAGEYPRAAQIASEALDHRELLFGGLGDEDAVIARSRWSAPADTGALAAARLKDVAGTLRFLESGRAGLLLESLGGRDALRWADLPQELVAAERTARERQAAAAADYRRAGRTDLAKRKAARDVLDDATQNVRKVMGRIQREAKAQAGLYYPRPVTLEQARAILRLGEALVIYGACHGEAIAVVVTKQGARVALLGKAEPIHKAGATFRALAADVDTRAARKTLVATLVKPLALGPGIKRVIWSPAGPLTFVPASVLFDQPTSSTPSATTLALLRNEPSTSGRGVLAIGDPEYGPVAAAPSKLYLRGGVLAPLPQTRIEVKKIGDVVLLGTAATEAGWREAVPKRPRWRAVHFACHGQVNHLIPNLCALALTPTKEDDGFLTAGEVARQRIPADLAVLSACETGDGFAVHGEGLVGLVRAFMFAGSPRIIASLWKVDDDATRELMVKFYSLWNPPKGGKRISAVEALRKAQEHIRDQPKWSHPHYWAAWTLWGLPD